MVNKPRRRKQKGHGGAYLILGIIVVLVATGALIAYTAKLGPFNNQSTSTTTTASTTTNTSTTTTEPVLYARINTTLGSFEVELYNSLTPKTVANFVSLVNQGFYNNLVWHRIEPGFVIQTGDPNTRNGGGSRSQWGEGSSGTSIPFEYATTLHNYAGYLAMASTGPEVGGTSQFFINLNDTNAASLDGKYAVFGKVITGMDVVRALGAVQVEYVGTYPQGQNEPVTPVYVTSITMISGP